ncbi:hypothetical protein BJ138DRAFT_1105788 [Hygrophoropsis aurantiaca]|uniref:Uncharacterized protein n=1 Tax=Hygrophoropsis aurantiaca TaxID=72124 RepID=A0ACB7ZX71_9AGAM|nr:hypothetical protein BJ138DRAFT_1105788 [Hygrophoropsis aurantiaca]
MPPARSSAAYPLSCQTIAVDYCSIDVDSVPVHHQCFPLTVETPETPAAQIDGDQNIDGNSLASQTTIGGNPPNRPEAEIHTLVIEDMYGSPVQVTDTQHADLQRLQNEPGGVTNLDTQTPGDAYNDRLCALKLDVETFLFATVTGLTKLGSGMMASGSILSQPTGVTRMLGKVNALKMQTPVPDKHGPIAFQILI